MGNKSTAEWIADFQKRSDETHGKIAELEAQREQAAFEAQLGDPGATAKLKDLDERLHHYRGYVRELQGAIHQAEARAREERAEAERKAEQAKIRSVGALADRKLASARRVQQCAEELGAAMRESHQIGVELARAVGTGEAVRVFGVPAFAARLQHTLANLFTADPEKGAGHESRDFLRLAINGADPRCKSTLIEEEEKAVFYVTAMIRHWESQEDAERAARYLRDQGHRVFALGSSAGTFHIVPAKA
ncbi:MAG TPA: hypothetical protein VKZ79_07635 [Alphaproteobacteria bacterium]|nr:hypothetical protein [Alphaproteobacteria bacterium]